MVDENQWVAVAGLHYAKVFKMQNIFQFLTFKPNFLKLLLWGLSFCFLDNLVSCRRHFYTKKIERFSAIYTITTFGLSERSEANGDLLQ